jgi:hypothetical protein
MGVMTRCGRGMRKVGGGWLQHAFDLIDTDYVSSPSATGYCLQTMGRRGKLESHNEPTALRTKRPHSSAVHTAFFLLGYDHTPSESVQWTAGPNHTYKPHLSLKFFESPHFLVYVPFRGDFITRAKKTPNAAHTEHVSRMSFKETRPFMNANVQKTGLSGVSNEW